MIYNNVKCVNTEDNLKLITYYKNLKTTHLIMKNNITPKGGPLKETNVIYKFNCKHVDCEPRNIAYVGLTTTTLSRRLTMHLQNGAIKKHYADEHKRKLTREDLVNNTVILNKSPDYQRLQILEALIIKNFRPYLNLQTTGSARTLQLHGNNL